MIVELLGLFRVKKKKSFHHPTQSSAVAWLGGVARGGGEPSWGSVTQITLHLCDNTLAAEMHVRSSVVDPSLPPISTFLLALPLTVGQDLA